MAFKSSIFAYSSVPVGCFDSKPAFVVRRLTPAAETGDFDQQPGADRDPKSADAAKPGGGSSAACACAPPIRYTAGVAKSLYRNSLS